MRTCEGHEPSLPYSEYIPLLSSPMKLQKISAHSHGATATATAICDKNGSHRVSIGCTTWCDCDCELRLWDIGVTGCRRYDHSQWVPYPCCATGICDTLQHPTTPIVVDSIAVAPCERALSYWRGRVKIQHRHKASPPHCCGITADRNYITQLQGPTSVCSQLIDLFVYGWSRTERIHKKTSEVSLHVVKRPHFIQMPLFLLQFQLLMNLS